ncbi:MAG: hypothetical protein U9R57_02600 [Thermodesulfobacteriota bacterium]|nr:hypothetical protein [Thermodesulfobacteriota bacterium]
MTGVENVTTKVKEHVALVTFDDVETNTESMQKALAEHSFAVEKIEVLQEEGTRSLSENRHFFSNRGIFKK